MFSRLVTFATALAVLFFPAAATAQQPLQWRYSFDSAGVATASYPGNVVVAGTVNGVRAFNIDSFGGDPTGVRFSDAAFGSALLAIGATGGVLTGEGCVILGAGTYKFNAPINVTLSQAARNSFCLRGQGMGTSKMLFPSTSGVAITLAGQENAVQVSDLSLLSGRALGGTALRMTNAGVFGGGDGNASNIDRVWIGGSDKTASHDAAVFYWTDGAISTGVSNINYNAISIVGSVPAGTGKGITFQGDATTSKFAVLCNVTASELYNLDVGFTVGTWQQGINITQTIFTNGKRAIFQPSGTVLSDMLSVTASQFDTTDDTIVIDGMTHANIVGNLFFTRATNSAFATLNGQYLTFQGNVINGNVGGAPGGTGFFAASNLPDSVGVVSGNVFHNLSLGVGLNTGTSGWNVQANAYKNNTQNNTNGGGASNSVGVATP